MDKKYVRVRDRHQITLPAELLSGLPIRVGDFIEIARTDNGSLIMRPTRLVTVGTPEAEQSEETARQNVAEGKYDTFTSVEDVRDHLASRRRQRKKKEVAHARAV